MVAISLFQLIKDSIWRIEKRFLQKRSYRFNYPNPESIIISFKSVEHEKCPPKPGIIRCETLIAGYLMHPDPSNSNNSILKILSQCDIKVNFSKFKFYVSRE